MTCNRRELLFAKDIPRYRSWVSKYYQGVRNMTPVSDTAINEHMTEMSLVSTPFSLIIPACSRVI